MANIVKDGKAMIQWDSTKQNAVKCHLHGNLGPGFQKK